MRFARILLLLLLLALMWPCASTTTQAQRTPINKGVLQSNLDANGNDITNGGTFRATAFVGDGSGLTNLAGPAFDLTLDGDTQVTGNMFFTEANKKAHFANGFFFESADATEVWNFLSTAEGKDDYTVARIGDVPTGLLNQSNNLSDVANSLTARTNIGAGPINSVNVLDYGAIGDGATDDTTAFQNALASGKPVFAPPWKTNGYVISNIILSNNTLHSYGAKLKMKVGSTGYMVQYAPAAIWPAYTGISNTWGNAKLIGLELDGGGGTTVPTSLGTRHGVWVDAYGVNNIFRDCNVHGFSGYGVLVTSSKPFLGSTPPYLITDMGQVSVSDSAASFNYYGFAFASGNIFNADAYLCEYVSATGLNSVSNAVGIWVGTGNLTIGSSVFSRNTTGVMLYTTQNDGHGVMSGCLINHNTSAIRATNISNGFTFTGCNIFQGDSYWTNCYGISYENGQAGGCAFTFDGGGLNYVRNTRNHASLGIPTFTRIGSGTNSVTYGNDNFQGTGTIDRLNYRVMSQTADTLSITNLTVGTMTGPPTTFGSTTLQGKGFPINVYSANNGTNQTSQWANVPLVSVPAGAEATYAIYCDEQSTASGTAGTLTTTFNYTDQFGSAKTVGGMTLTLGTAGGAHTNAVYFLKAKRSTTIGITTVITGGGGGSTYSLDTEIFQLR